MVTTSSQPLFIAIAATIVSAQRVSLYALRIHQTRLLLLDHYNQTPYVFGYFRHELIALICFLVLPLRELPINSLPESLFYSNIPQWQSLRSFDHILIDFHRFFCQLYPLLINLVLRLLMRGPLSRFITNSLIRL